MTAPINTGGPAFPVADTHHANGQIEFGANGMTLRDYFAGQALIGLLANPNYGAPDPSKDAITAYHEGDAMIAARDAKPEGAS